MALNKPGTQRIMAAKVESIGLGEYRLSGELNMHSVKPLIPALTSSMLKGPLELQIDLGGVTRSDSAGLALLIEWMRQARARNKTVKFSNLPQQLREIAQISDLLPILPLD